MLAVLLAGLGLWFLLEGALYAAAPDAMKRFGALISQLPETSVRQSGLLSMALGGVLLYAMIRFG
ncbi:MAG: DUF2065 domain-containing protein [Pseudomonadota bacterium]